jgi:hypothetical protein
MKRMDRIAVERGSNPVGSNVTNPTKERTLIQQRKGMITRLNRQEHQKMQAILSWVRTSLTGVDI